MLKRKQIDQHLVVMTLKDRVIYILLIILWFVVNFRFWSWWWQPNHLVAPFLFLVMSLALFYESTFLPSCFLFFMGRMRQPRNRRSKAGLKVALITPCVPSKESATIIEQQLKAMNAVRYPHDSWVLDEEGNSQVKALARKHGVNYFTRYGVSRYNQQKPPFKAKTKAGNVNAWLDKYGQRYEYFTQFDIDHHPKSNYLHRVLGHFKDSLVAWVQAPSIYNNFQHWTARGAAEQELALQGPLQMGFYGYSETPFIIGSHSTYRTRAIMEIGGFQPTRAEDHLDTVALAGAGYKGVYVFESIAVGDGPENFETYLGQQFAWAYSMTQILLHHTAKYFRDYSFKRKFQFLFAQTWYPLWSWSMGLLFSLPIIALAFNRPIAAMPFLQTLTLFLPIQLVSFGAWFWSFKQGWFRPQKLALSWRGIILNIARWPVVFWATINAILGVKRPYMVTAKGIVKNQAQSFRLTSQVPYLTLFSLSLLGAWFFIWRTGQGRAQGYLLFTIQGAVVMLSVYTIVLAMNIREAFLSGVSRLRALSLHTKPLLLFLGLSTSAFLTGYSSFKPVSQALTWQPPSNQHHSFSKECYAADSIFYQFRQGEKCPDNEVFLGENTLAMTTRNEEPEVYIVQQGDNLWQIAQQVYLDGTNWRRIAEDNQLQNPRLIHPGQELVLEKP